MNGFFCCKQARELAQNQDAWIIDVREEDEIRETGIAVGAHWMPLSKISEGHPDWIAFKEQMPKDKTICLYCRSGARSGRICDLLEMEGYVTKNLGGLKDWQAAGLEVCAFPGKTS